MMTSEQLEIASEDLLIARIRELSAPMAERPTGVDAQLAPLPEVKAVLFDIYGTLLISGSGDIGVAGEMAQANALTDSLRCAGFTGQLDEAGHRGGDLLLEAIRATHSRRRAEGIEYPEVDIREEWHHVVNELQVTLNGPMLYDAVQRLSVEYECRVNPVWPMADVPATLRTLWDRNMLLGIVSNAQFYTPLIFPALFSQTFMALGFNPYLCAFSYELREAKPSPRLFQGILEHLQREFTVSAAETLYVGNDMVNDVWTASQCGLKTALFAGDARSLRLRENDERCADLRPDVVITCLSQLAEVVNAPI